MEDQASATMKKFLLLFNCILLAIGNCGGPLVLRLYFIRGGKRIWLSSWLQTGGWPIFFIPLFITYLHRRKTKGAGTKLFLMNPILFIFTAVIGVFTGLDDYLYAYGMALLPVSTCTLITSTHLAFIAGFAFFLVNQKFTGYSINAVVMLTIGAAVLALHTSSDRPEGESNSKYVLGFVLTFVGALLYGILLPSVELAYMKAKQAITYTLVMEVQLVMCFFATVFCTVGMIINKDFQVIPREARNYELGEAKYYLVLVLNAVLWQLYFLGSIGVVFCASSLLSGIIIAVLVPVIEVLGVVFFHEKFTPEKGVALVLCLWGFVSYFYGEMKHSKVKSEASDMQMTEATNPRSGICI